MGERAVVTGGAGFIGSHLVDALLARGCEVHVLDDLSRGSRERLDERATLHVVDVADPVALDAAVAGIGPVNAWYHLAAQIDVRVSVADPMLDARVNVLGTLAVLRAAERDGAPVVFFSSGGAIYGDAPPPTPETAPARPMAPYGTAKLAGEEYVAQHARLTGSRHAVVRPANVYGPRQDPLGEGGVIAIFSGCALEGRAARVFGDGSQTRDFVYVGDVVEVALAAADAARSGADAALRADGDIPVYNVGTGVETSVLELWETMQRAVGRELGVQHEPAKVGEVQRSVLDATLARRTLGVGIRTGLDEGVGATLAWLRGAASVS